MASRGAMNGPGSLVLSILMIGAAMLTAGGLHLIIRRGERLKGGLMIAAAAVAVGNVLILTL